MDKAHKSTCKHIITTIIGSTGIFCYLPTVQADVTFDGTMGPGGTLTGPQMEITADMGQMAGNNLYHSFSDFNVDSGQTANFSGPTNVQNVFGRVTGSNPSNIDGTISSSIQGANLFLMNPNGMLFGPNAQINISGSFHATTADYIKLGEQDHFYADINQNTTLSVAAPTAFGFLDNSVSDISITSSQLNLAVGKSVSIVGGNINITDGAVINAQDGQINLASTQLAGEISIAIDDTDVTNLDDRGIVTVDNFSALDTSGLSSGKIVIRGGNLVVANSSSIVSDAYGTESVSGPGIDIKTPGDVTIRDDSQLRTDSAMGASADSRGIEISADSVTASNNSGISSNAQFFSQGNGGNVAITSNSTTLEDYSYIVTTNDSAGSSGDININSSDVSIVNGSYLFSGSFYFSNLGDAGTIAINSKNLTISGPDASLDPLSQSFTGIGISTGVNNNAEENITINAGNITLSNNANIYTYNKGANLSGDIKLNGENVLVFSGSNIVTTGESFTNSDAGNININASRVTISGVYENFAATRSGLFSQLYNSDGTSGDINIEANQVEVSDGALIKTNSPSGIGGNISISSHTVTVDGFSEYKRDQLIAEQEFYTGTSDIVTSTVGAISEIITENSANNTDEANAGNISITSSNLKVSNGAKINTRTVSATDGGNVQISTDQLSIENGGSITSSSVAGAIDGNGAAGEISIESKTINIVGGNNTIFPTGIFSQSNVFGTGGGDIGIDTYQLSMDNGAQINSETMGEGNGGYISISAIESVLLTKQSGITTSASSDISTSNAGNVVIETGLLMLDNSSIQTTAIAGNGGNIDISANNIIVTSDSTIDASSELAVSGRINITTRNDIKSSLTKLPDTTNNVEDLFKNECDINREASQFRISKNSLIHSNHLQSPSSYFMNDIQSSSTSTVQKDNFYYKEDVETFQQLAQLYNDLMDLTYKGCLISSATN